MRTAMDKFTVNNQVVKMRGVVSRAKVVVIRKLIRKARQLENKDKEKFERLLKDIIAVKKQSHDKISKFALENKKCLSKCMSDGLHISTDDRALYRIANHPYVVNEVNKFRKLYGDWEKELPMILRVLGVKVKKKQKKEKCVTGDDDLLEERKSRDIEERSSQDIECSSGDVERSSRDIERSSRDIERSSQDIERSSPDIERTGRDIEELTSTKQKTQRKRKKLANHESRLLERDSTEEESSDELSSSERENKKTRRKEETSDKTKVNSAEIIYLNLSDMMCEELPATTPKCNDETDSTTTRKKLSSFFLGGEDDDENVSLIKSERGEDERGLNRKQRRNLLFGREVNYSKWPKKEQQSQRKREEFVNKWPKKEQQPEIKREQSSTKTAHEEPKLHPSWAAKKQQRQVVVPFMGKKIKFDND